MRACHCMRCLLRRKRGFAAQMRFWQNPPMLMSWIAVIGGLLVLVWGAERFIEGASVLARNLGVSPLIIGLTIVGLGTSAPEMIVSATAALQGNTNLSIGNAIGSNITNIALVLGATALIVPLTVRTSIINREIPILVGVTAFAGVLLLDGELSRMDGMLLLAGVVVLILLVVHLAHSTRSTDPIITEIENELPGKMSTARSVRTLLAGLVVLLIGSKLLVWGAVDIAQSMGVSDLIIGLTIVAIGTSLPELAASVISTLKNEPDVAIGNIIGSNMFNLLAVLGLPGLIAPGVFNPEVMQRDFPIMAGLTLVLALAFIAWSLRGSIKIGRKTGLSLLICFCAYQYLLYSSTIAPA